jgi:hypothetical protein
MWGNDFFGLIIVTEERGACDVNALRYVDTVGLLFLR